MFIDLDWPLNASSPLSASAELLVSLHDEKRCYIQLFFLTVIAVLIMCPCCTCTIPFRCTTLHSFTWHINHNIFVHQIKGKKAGLYRYYFLILSCAKSHMLSASRRQPHLLHESAVDLRQIWSVDKSWWCMTLSGFLHSHIVRCWRSPFLVACITVALACLKTIQQRLLTLVKIKTGKSDCGVYH